VFVGFIGFGAKGVKAGTIAASIHKSIGAVKAGSAFAKATSIGMQFILWFSTLFSHIKLPTICRFFKQ